MSPWKWLEEGYTVIRTTCGSGSNTCYSTCGMLLYLKDGRLIKVEGDETFPLNQGRLCVKALALPQLVYHPDRILHPAKRIGERGEGKWQIISWEEAIEIIAERLREIMEKYGPEAIATFSGGGRGLTTYLSYFTWSLGSPNWATHLDLCLGPKIMANLLTTGNGTEPWIDFAHQFPDRYKNPRWRRPSCVIVWGANPIVSNFSYQGCWIVDLMKMGTKLIVIDPRLTWLASKAEYWLQIRPGTDGALALGMLNIIVNEGLYDREFVEKWTNAPFLVRMDNNKLLREKDITGKGENFVVYDEISKDYVTWDIYELRYSKLNVKPALEGTFKVRLADGTLCECKTVWQVFKDRLKDYIPERVSEITGIPAEKIIGATRFFANNRPGGAWIGVSVDQTTNGVETARAIILLVILTGNWDVPGGWTSEKKPCIFSPEWGLDVSKLVISFDMVWGYENLPPEQRPKAIGLDDLPLLKMWSWFGAGFPLPPSFIWKAIVSGKPYQIKALLLFGGGIPLIACADSNLVYQALKKVDFLVVADLFPSPVTELADIVIPSASIVERDLLRSWYYPLTYQTKALEVSSNAKWDLEILLELGKRLKPERWPWRNIKEFFDWCLKPIGITWDQLKEKGYIYPPYEYEKYKKGWERFDGKPGFPTPSGKVEIWSILRERVGLDPLPHYEEPFESPISTPHLLKEYPLILTIGGRLWGFFHSEGRQIPWLRELHPDPIAEINPETAKKFGIKDGDWIFIETRRGKFKMRAKLSLGIRPDVVRVEHNWWYPERLGRGDPLFTGVLEPTANFCVSSEHLGRELASPCMRAMLCKIYKAES